MRTGLFGIEALGREPTRVGGRRVSLSRTVADRRRARDDSNGEVDKSGRDGKDAAPRPAPPLPLTRRRLG
jgi:hypothetical protein